ncbi:MULTISPECIES: hypothetical protein [unclassified Bradyrhizobium]|nr:MULTISPECIES: hypothetical protein [unclassified Bradyrhizobium]
MTAALPPRFIFFVSRMIVASFMGKSGRVPALHAFRPAIMYQL